MAKRQINQEQQPSFCRSRAAGAIIDTLWHDDHFVLTDLTLDAAFPEGWAEGESAVRDYAFELDVPLGTVSGSKLARTPEVMACIKGIEVTTAEIVPHKRTDDKESWIVYIPFDTSDFLLGGSEYENRLGIPCGAAPAIDDAPYFADCYEVVREMVEDGVVQAGITVLDGGLEKALKAFGEATIDLSGVLKAYPGTDAEHVLHAEIPGVLLQIDDADFDYLDAEFILQDIAYYPLGHPAAKQEFRLSNGIQDLLGALIK